MTFTLFTPYAWFKKFKIINSYPANLFKLGENKK